MGYYLKKKKITGLHCLYVAQFCSKKKNTPCSAHFPENKNKKYVRLICSPPHTTHTLQGSAIGWQAASSNHTLLFLPRFFFSSFRNIKLRGPDNFFVPSKDSLPSLRGGAAAGREKTQQTWLPPSWSRSNRQIHAPPKPRYMLLKTRVSLGHFFL